jgi:hypothetical protein
MSETPTPPSGPKKQGKSLTEIFNKFAADAVERFPHLKGQLLVVDMNEMKAHGNSEIDFKKTGLTPQTALDYISEHPITNEMLKDKNMSSLATFDPKRNLSLVYINDSVPKDQRKNVSKEDEEHLLFVLDHELAHCALKDGFARATSSRDYAILLGESVADAYALIRYYQRYGADSDSKNKYVSPAARADNFMLWGDSTHFTSFVLDAIAQRKHLIDFDKLTPQQTADLARRFALQYMPPKRVVEDIAADFAPVRSAFRKNPNDGVKALIEKTLADGADYYTFKFGSLWLKGFLDEGKFPDGKPLQLPKSYLDDVKVKLAAREAKFAKEDILFNMPIVPPKPPQGNFGAPRIAA